MVTCPKFNLVGPVEWDNLTLAQKIGSQNKELKYKMVDFHSSRLYDLRYALDGTLMKELGTKSIY